MFRYLLPLLLWPPTASAQKKPLRLMVEAGAGVSSLRNPGPNNSSRLLPSVAAGIQLLAPLKGRLSLQTGMDIGSKNGRLRVARITRGAITGYPVYDYHTTWLSVPVLFRHTFPGKTGLFLQGGPFVAALITNRAFRENEQLANEGGRYRPIDAGVAFGIGASFPVRGGMLLQTGLRDELGLTRVERKQFDYQSDYKTHALRLMFGLIFPL